MIRLMLVDDHKMLRLGLVALFGSVADIEVVAEAASVKEAVFEARRSRPDVVLMDVRLPDGTGVDACRAICLEQPEARVIMLTSYPDDEAVLASIQAGASGYLLKQTDPERLIEGVKKVAAGAALLDPDVTRVALDFMRQGGPLPTLDTLAGLTDQERRVLPLIAEGKTNREIGEELALSPHTIKTYVSSILQKLNLVRRSQAAAFVTRVEAEPHRFT